MTRRGDKEKMTRQENNCKKEKRTRTVDKGNKDLMPGKGISKIGWLEKEKQKMKR
jgi:hypothetical protein